MRNKGLTFDSFGSLNSYLHTFPKMRGRNAGKSWLMQSIGWDLAAKHGHDAVVVCTHDRKGHMVNIRCTTSETGPFANTFLPRKPNPELMAGGAWVPQYLEGEETK